MILCRGLCRGNDRTAAIPLLRPRQCIRVWQWLWATW